MRKVKDITCINPGYFRLRGFCSRPRRRKLNFGFLWEKSSPLPHSRGVPVPAMGNGEESMHFESDCLQIEEGEYSPSLALELDEFFHLRSLFTLFSFFLFIVSSILVQISLLRMLV
uniref:Uncharacterized protein n=1 Tax=Brassica oleracea var. oleracea TaxID=109376 RepID=A0A0D3EIE7_BRAOL